MEKLQAALEKARLQRQEAMARQMAEADGAPATAGAAPSAYAAPPAASAPADAGDWLPGFTPESIWKDLRPFQPSEGHLQVHRVISRTTGRQSNGFDALRTRILHMMRTNNWKRLAITSPAAGSGKTTVSLNLALSFARQPELRTVLMDLDMRRPSLGKVLGLPNDHKVGLAEVLRGELPFADLAWRIGDNLAVAANTVAVEQSAELLHSDACGDALERIEAEMAPSIMLFDLPPLFACDDTPSFLRHVDCAVLVVESDVTTISEVERSEKELSDQTNFLGVVLNKTRFSEDASRYGYYYY